MAFILSGLCAKNSFYIEPINPYIKCLLYLASAVQVIELVPSVCVSGFAGATTTTVQTAQWAWYVLGLCEDTNQPQINYLTD